MATRSARRIDKKRGGGRLLRRLALLALAGVIALGSAFLGAQYVYQQPAREAVGRLLASEIEWQRGKYPSAGFLFDTASALFPAPVTTFGSSWLTFKRDVQSWPSKIGTAAGADAPLCYDRSGNPLPTARGGTASLEGTCHFAFSRSVRDVASASDLVDALRNVPAGTTIRVAPGVYPISAHAVALGNAGRADAPIWVIAPALGDVRIELDTLEGFLVDQPYWAFENLEITGACAKDANCEHAFHIVGRGARAVLRNNTVRNFNAPIKGNSDREKNHPDGALIEGNRFYNDAPRQTDSSVTLIDVVAASDWNVRRNFIADFAKTGADQTSYAAFFKGAGERGVFERNLVMCEWKHRGGTRVGLSLGGGGTIPQLCRDGECRYEQRGGTIRSNIILNCSDVGIYLNKAADSQIHNNLVARTRGIDARYAETSAAIANNVVDGRVMARDGATAREEANLGGWWDAAWLKRRSDALFVAPAGGDFRARDSSELKGAGTAVDRDFEDFCGQRVPADQPPIGPFLAGVALPCPRR